MAIDDPLDQIHAQHRDRDQADVLAPVLNVSAIVVGLVNSGIGAAVGIAALLNQLVDTRRGAASAAALHSGLVEAFRTCEGRLETVEEKVKGLDAEEAFVKAARAALMTPRLEKARRMGQILGSTLAQDSPNWQEAAEFIANLEQFGDGDVEAIRILWKVQRNAYHLRPTTGHYMDAGDSSYLKSWPQVMERTRKVGIVDDDWLARCARLGGFGMAVTVQTTSPLQGQAGPIVRITTRAVRLLKLLQLFVDPSAYPAARYHATLGSKTVNDEDEDAALGDGWSDRPTPPVAG